MKLFIALCVLLAVAAADWAPKTAEEIAQIRAECFISEKVTEENMEKIRKNQFPDEADVRCYVRCSAAKTGTWDDVNGFNVERSIQQLEKVRTSATNEDLKKCFLPNVNNVDLCTWAYQCYKCVLDNKYITKSVGN